MSQTIVFPHTFQAAVAAQANGTPMDVGGLNTLGVQITGITTATVTFEATIDGSNWVAVRATNANSGSAATTATADGLYTLDVRGLGQVRCRISAHTTGTITITGQGVV